MAARRAVLRVVAACVALAGLAVVSFLTTARHCSNGYSEARYEITFRDGAGQPIAGVVMEVDGPVRPYVGEGRAGSWPVYESGVSPLVSDENGLLVFHQAEYGPQFCWGEWRLFWVFCVTDGPPRFRCRFRKQGFAPVERDLFELERALRRQDAAGSRNIKKGPSGRDCLVVTLTVALTAAG